MSTYLEPRAVSPALPAPRGPVSSFLVTALRSGGQDTPEPVGPSSWKANALAAGDADPYGDDLQLALYVLYELHYQGFAGVPDAWEWDPDLLGLRRVLEDRFLTAVREPLSGSDDVPAALRELLLEPVDPGPTSVSGFLHDEGTAEHLREYAALRSLYHLKEADPHAWVLPRLHGRAKAAMVAIEFDEFGAGRAENIHARLYADLLEDLGLATGYGHYLDATPAVALATVNLMSLLGLHRSLRGALVGHFATVEVTSPPGSRRLAQAMRRLGVGPAAQRFYDEHVEADAVHEQVVRGEVVEGLLADSPHLARDVVMGIEATNLLEDRLAAHVLSAWRAGRSALRTPLDPWAPAG